MDLRAELMQTPGSSWFRSPADIRQIAAEISKQGWPDDAALQAGKTAVASGQSVEDVVALARAAGAAGWKDGGLEAAAFEAAVQSWHGGESGAQAIRGAASMGMAPRYELEAARVGLDSWRRGDSTARIAGSVGSGRWSEDSHELQAFKTLVNSYRSPEGAERIAAAINRLDWTSADKLAALKLAAPSFAGADDVAQHAAAADATGRSSREELGHFARLMGAAAQPPS